MAIFALKMQFCKLGLKVVSNIDYKTFLNDTRLMYTGQRNYCLSLTRKQKEQFYENLHIKDNKFFLENKPSFLDKLIIKHNDRLENDGNWQKWSC